MELPQVYVSKVSIRRGRPVYHLKGRTINGNQRAACGITHLRHCIQVESSPVAKNRYPGARECKKCSNSIQYR